MPILASQERLGTLLAGKYQLERILGEGGMGVVFEAVHTWTGRRVAVKMLQAHYSLDATIGTRFLQEARTATALRHPNVVDVLDMGSDTDGSAYIVMELLEGESLSGALRRGALSLKDTLTVLLPAMGALASAHDKGFIHRDLKPDNIFLHRDEEDGQIVSKVLDFGLAKVREQGAMTRTRTGMVMGTPYYIAPEQARSDPAVGPPADVWAMAVVVYECVSGQVPFSGDSPTSVILQVCTEEVPLLASRVEVHPAVADVVHGALRKLPAERYQNMRAFALALIEAARAAGVEVATPRGLLERSGSVPALLPVAPPIKPPPASRSGIERSPAPVVPLRPPTDPSIGTDETVAAKPSARADAASSAGDTTIEPGTTDPGASGPPSTVIMGQAPPPAAPVSWVAEPPAAPSRGRTGLVLAACVAGALLLAGLIVGVVFLLGGLDPAEPVATPIPPSNGVEPVPAPAPPSPAVAPSVEPAAPELAAEAAPPPAVAPPAEPAAEAVPPAAVDPAPEQVPVEPASPTAEAAPPAETAPATEPEPTRARSRSARTADGDERPAPRRRRNRISSEW